MDFDETFALQAVTPEQTRTFTLYGITCNSALPPTLTVRVAGQANPKWRSMVAKLDDGKALASARASDTLRAYLDERDAKLIAQGDVVVSWDNVNDKTGTPVPCDPANLESFLVALARRIPEKLRPLVGYVTDHDNFRPAALPKAAELGKG